MQQINSIGFIGVGLMGHGMAANLISKGFDVTVMGHRNRIPVDDLVSRGAREAMSLKALAQENQAIILCVTGSPQVESLLLSDHGILACANPGLTVIDCSTGEPATTSKLAEICKQYGVCLVDAPLGRTPIEARQGKLNVMVGADNATLQKIKPVLSAFSENIFHAGPVSSAHKLKLLNNFVTMGITTLIAEAVAICEPLGLDLRLVHDLLSKGASNNLILQRLLGGVLEGDYGRLAFTIRNAAKDVSYYNNMIAAYVDDCMLAPRMLDILQQAVNQGDGEKLLSSLVEGNRARHKKVE